MLYFVKALSPSELTLAKIESSLTVLKSLASLIISSLIAVVSSLEAARGNAT